MNEQILVGKTKSEWISAFAGAGPAIQLRLRRDVFDDISEDTQNYLWQTLQTDRRVMQLLQMQDDDGWFFAAFHGYDSMESSIRFLIEMGFTAKWSPLQKASAALLNAGQDKLLKGIGKVGQLLEEEGLSGSNTIRAWLLALLACETVDIVHAAVERTMKVIRFAASVEKISDIAYKRGRYDLLKDHCVWPDLYHFRLLSATSLWRTSANLQLVGDCVENMCRLQPVPVLYGYSANQPIAPASFGLQVITPNPHDLSAAEWMAWFQRMILFAQLGVISTSRSISTYYDSFQQWLSQFDGWFELPLKHPYFVKWGAYTGLMLEENWRKKSSRIFDLSFRCLLIEALKRIMENKKLVLDVL